MNIELLKKQIAFQKAGMDAGFPITEKQKEWLDQAQLLLDSLNALREIVWQSSVEDECNEIASSVLLKHSIPFK